MPSYAELNVSLPAAEGLGVRWRWTRWTQQGVGLCEFECLAPFLLFVSASGGKFCYTNAEYSAHLQLLHSELRLVAPVPGPPMRDARPATLKFVANASNASIANATFTDTMGFPGGYVAAALSASVLVGLLAVCVLL